MKKFEFRLERVERWRVLQMRLQEEKTRKAAEVLALARRELNSVGEIARTAAAEMQRGGTATAMAAYPGFLERNAKDRDLALARIQRLATAVNQERGVLLEMHRGVRLLELLHETRRAEWTAKANKEEEEFAGEAFLGRVQSKERARSSSG